MLAQRITYVGELGFELYVAPEWAVQVWDRLLASGEPYGIEPGGYRALESLRLEKGYRYFGTDLTAGDTPYEAGLGFCVALEKGEFNGRRALAQAGERPARRLRTLLVGGDEYVPVYGGEAVRAAGRGRWPASERGLRVHGRHATSGWRTCPRRSSPAHSSRSRCSGSW